MSEPKRLVRQFWFEAERGWGMRPDGYTLHLDEAGREKFVSEFLKQQDERAGGRVPDEYNFVGAVETVKVSAALYDRVHAEITEQGTTYWRTKPLTSLEEEAA